MKKYCIFAISALLFLTNNQIFSYKSLQEAKTDIDATLKLIDEDIKQIQDAYDPKLKNYLVKKEKVENIKDSSEKFGYGKLLRLLRAFNRHYRAFNRKYNDADDLYKSRELIMRDHAALKKYLTEIENKMDHIINIIRELGMIGFVDYQTPSPIK